MKDLRQHIFIATSMLFWFPWKNNKIRFYRETKLTENQTVVSDPLPYNVRSQRSEPLKIKVLAITSRSLAPDPKHYSGLPQGRAGYRSGDLELPDGLGLLPGRCGLRRGNLLYCAIFSGCCALSAFCRIVAFISSTEDDASSAEAACTVAPWDICSAPDDNCRLPEAGFSDQQQPSISEQSSLAFAHA